MSKKLIATYDDIISGWNGGPESTAIKALRAVFPLPFMLADAMPGLLSYLKGQGQVSKDDAENLQTIIRAGREQGVDEMHIKISKDQFAGIKAKGAIKDAGADIDIGLGASGSSEYVVNVKYK